MASFSSWNGEKMHGHHYLLTEVLKKRMGLDGLIVGDWNGHGQLPGCTNVSCPDAINAGLDLFMAVEDWKDLYKNTLQQVKGGEIPMSRLDDAVTRVLRVKARAGLFDKGKPSDRGIAGSNDVIGSDPHREVARQAVRESMVLLKNNGGLLPIAPTSNILVAGDGADSMGKQTGGWTITWQGTDNENSDFPGGTTILDGIRQLVEQSGGKVSHSPNGNYDSKPDVAIVVFGEDPYAEFQGDLDSLEFEPVHKQALGLIKKLNEDNVPVVSVFLSGRPMWVNPEINASDAFIAAWLPGSEGVGLADVLIAGADGKPVHDFTGRLSFSWPKLPLQGVLNPHHDNYDPLFTLGYGLDYSSSNEALALLDEDVEGVKDGDDGDITLYHGRPLAPWAVFVEGDYSEASILSGPYAAHVSGQITAQTADMDVQEDALRIDFNGGGAAGLYIGSSEMDMSRFLGSGTLDFRIRIDSLPEGELSLSVNHKSIALNDRIGEIVGKGWQPISVPIACFAENAEDLSNVTQPFRLGASTKMQVSVGFIILKAGNNEDAECN
jgi:beta-glucosidase